eukprot:TRINITY_DN37483_c0_g1_i1.p2 TRINITY_DN37483_c0_g1~~TRINITY_DN37483_c0_g1_i1.p2  ORF type:complete len:114 (+),score=26.56 TRINITY_DN37483_c0_g1_i1:93-434(+)
MQQTELTKLQQQVDQLKLMMQDKEKALQQMAEKIAALNQELNSYQEATYKESGQIEELNKKITKKKQLISQELDDIKYLNSQYQIMIKSNSQLQLDLRRIESVTRKRQLRQKK